MLGALRHPFPPNIRQLLSSYSRSPGRRKKIEVCGWVKSVRKQKNVSFAVLSDGSSTHGLQAVFRNEDVPKTLTNGCSVKLQGTLVESPGAKQALEFQVENAEVVGECDPETYPIQKQALTTEYLRDQCHLRARVDRLGKVLRVRDSLTRAAHEYFEQMGFMNVHTPIITASDCEGAGEAFSVTASPPTILDANNPSESKAKDVHFFGRPAFLTVSAQLHLEALAQAHNRVYTLGPSFRAEKSQTGRHLAEFWMLEAEWMFTKDIKELCDVVEDLLKHMLACVKRDEGDQDQELGERIEQTFERIGSWQRADYSSVIFLLQRASTKFEFTPTMESGLQSEHEKWLAEHFGGPVFITRYPRAQKPFYMRDTSSTSDKVECFDLLVPGIGELVGGSLREERLDHLDESMKRHGLFGREEYEWYRELRKFGGAPHGGFGLGFERLVSAVSGQPNVRECIAMPRWAGRMLL